MDKDLAKHVISLFWKHPRKCPPDIIDAKIFKEYIDYARTICNPIISDDASQILLKGYINRRLLGQLMTQIRITPRHLESSIRLSESLARMKLKSTVICDDA